MQRVGKQAVCQHMSSLVQEIDAGEILDLLLEKNQISLRQYRNILEMSDEHDRARHVLLHVMEAISFEEFLKLLKKTGVDGQLIQKLKQSTLVNEREEESSDSDDREDLQRNISKNLTNNVKTLNLRSINSTNIFKFGADCKSGQGFSGALEAKAEKRRKREHETHGDAPPRSLPEAEESLSMPERQRIFEIMHNTMLHDPDCFGGERYPCITYCLVTVNGRKASRILERSGYFHCEEQAVLDLMTKIDKGLFHGPELTIVFYTNWSCSPTSVNSIVNFLNWSQRKGIVIKLRIKVAALFHITWPACEEKECGHLHFSCHDDNYLRGIQKLFQCGVSVQGFDEASWGFLKKALKLPVSGSPCSVHRLKTDHMVQLSLRTIRESAC